MSPWAKVRDYVWLEGRPLAQVEYTGGGGGPSSVYYAHVDHLGTPRMLTNEVGELVWSTFQRPYGEVREKTKVDTRTGRVVVTNLRLPGQYDERLFATAGISGLQGPYYNWNRWYLPGLGRYLEPDPVALRGRFNGAVGVEWYGYAEENPLSSFDPGGLDRYDWCKDRNRIGKWICKKLTDWRCDRSAGERHLCCEADAAECRTAANGDAMELEKCELKKIECELKKPPCEKK